MSDGTALNKKVPWLYFLALLSQRIANFIAGAYLIYYITDRMLITALVMGAIMFVARIADLITGVLAGVVIQKFCLKHGQFRTWLLYAPFAVGIGTTLCFINPAIPVMAKAVIVFIGYVLYGTGMSFAQLAQNGLMSKIAGPNMNSRGAITAKILQGQQVGGIIGSAITMPLILFVEKFGLDGYTVIHVILVTVGVLGQLPLFFMTREYESFDPDFKSAGQGSVKLGTMFSETLKNGQLLILLLADAMRYTSYMSMNALAVYYFRYVAQNMAMLPVALTTQSVAGLIGAIAGRPIARKLGKKPSGITTGLLCGLSFCALAVFGGFGPYVYIICASGVYFCWAIIGAWGVNLYLDCGEYQLYKTGKDNRTFTMSMYGISIKIGFAISSIAIAFLLEASGYDGATNTVANVDMMRMLIGGIIGGLFLVYMLLMLLYGITEEKSKEYAEHNHQAAQAAKAASAG